MQYYIGIASIGNTFFSIARVLQYFLKMGIGISIANTFIEYWYCNPFLKFVLVLVLAILFIGCIGISIANTFL